MNYSKLSKQEAINVIKNATNRVKEIDFKTVDGIVSRMDFDYPTNQAGGTGYETVEVDYENQVVNVELKAYGCNYNQPNLNNENEIKKALGEIGYSLDIESIDD